jgi:predicted AlkP superfamily phosphohydrolase/phosphomutase
VVRGITQGLEALVDDKTGEKPVTRVFRREEIYNGFDPALIPDLRVANALNYRVSWQTTLGGVPPDLIEDNLKAWSADHCSNDPELVKGILFSTKKLAVTDPKISDLAPSVLSLMDVKPPAGLDGRSVFGGAP